MAVTDLKERTQIFSFRIIQFVEKLPPGFVPGVLARQLVRAGTSVGANYRSACRGKSKPDFIAKMGLVEEEADEVMYWLEVLQRTGLVEQECIQDLYQEANALCAIAVSSIKTARAV